MSNFIYGVRTKKLKQKYFGDIVSAEVINTKAKKKNAIEDLDNQLIKEIKNEINNRTTRANKKRK